jgi:hypothetical protein
MVQLPAGGAEGETGCVRILRDLDASGSPFRSRNVWVGGLGVAFFSSAIYSIERFDARPAVRLQPQRCLADGRAAALLRTCEKTSICCCDCFKFVGLLGRRSVRSAATTRQLCAALIIHGALPAASGTLRIVKTPAAALRSIFSQALRPCEKTFACCGRRCKTMVVER